LGGNIGAAWLHLPQERCNRLTAFYDQNGTTVVDISKSEDIDMQFGVGLIGWVTKNQTPVNIACLKEDPRWIPVWYVDDVQSMLAAPILDGENLLGVISIQHHQINAFDDSHLDLLQVLCQQISLALSNARRYQDVDHLVSLLVAEQYRLEDLVEMLPVGVLLLDENGNLLVTNSLARDFLAHLTPKETIGLTISHLEQYSISEILDQHTDSLPTEITVGDPLRKTFEVQAQPLGTEIPQWVVTLRDVTQEREFQARVQMQERLATVGQLAAGIAHDFNNIMAAIVVYADLLLMDASLSPSSKERLTIIQQQIQRAASLIRQILDFSRRSVMEQRKLDLLPFLKELEKLLRRTLPETITVELIHQDDEFIIMADPTRLQQVFMNLAVNARDAMPNGGILRFEMSYLNVLAGDIPPTPDMPPGKWLHAIVADNGLGITLEDQSHIFEPFFTTKPIGEGTGLGLAQVYGIIKQHGGYIDMISQVGEGTQFNIYLPAYSEDELEPQKIEDPLELDGDGKTVLLVEDDLATRKALEAMLTAHNYYVLVAENGTKAIEHLEKNASSVVLVVSDIVMPKMGGLDLYEILRSRWPQIQVLFITGHPLDEKNQKILQQGEVRWLQKPFTVQEFNQVLVELLADV
jgi:signal transduction histidine kinase/ActR/RegA family two-component response regulator